MNTSRLKELLNYDSDTGVFTWRVKVGNKSPNDIAGYRDRFGYVHIGVDGYNYLAHRLVFLYMEGSFPPDEVDHINRETSDNRWANLRHTVPRQNHENRKDNTKFIGVCWHKTLCVWFARTPRNNGKQKHIGMYKTHFAACYARHWWEICNE